MENDIAAALLDSGPSIIISQCFGGYLVVASEQIVDEDGDDFIATGVPHVHTDVEVMLNAVKRIICDWKLVSNEDFEKIEKELRSKVKPKPKKPDDSKTSE